MKQSTAQVKANLLNEIHEIIGSDTRVAVVPSHVATVRQSDSVSTVPMDVIIRRRIDKALKELRSQKLSDGQFQFKLSKVLGQVELTEVGNAIRFVARYGHLFHYVPERDKFFFYDGRRWIPDDNFMIVSYAKRVSSYLSVEADTLPLPSDVEGHPLMLPQIEAGRQPTTEERFIIAKFEEREERAKELNKWGIACRSKAKVNATIELIKDEPNITISIVKFDTDANLFNCSNGTIDLDSFSLLGHDPNNLITKMSSVKFEQDATSPVWDAFNLKVMCNDQSKVDFIQKISGMGMYGGQMDDIFPVFHGNGSNGKTMWCTEVKYIGGDYTGTATPSMFMERKNEGGDFENATLVGVRFLVKSETKQGRRLDEGMVKTMVGQEPISACYKFKDYFEFQPVFTPVLLTNHPPIISGGDDGIWRRVKLVPWGHNFETDPEKKSKESVLAEFKKEESGILNWMLEGLKKAKADMDNHGGIQSPDSIKDATDEYRKRNDLIGACLDECFEIGHTDNHWVTLAIAYKRYRSFMDEAGSHALNKMNFGEEMRKKGFDQGRSGPRGHYWIGLKVRPWVGSEGNVPSELSHIQEYQNVQAPTPPPIAPIDPNNFTEYDRRQLVLLQSKMRQCGKDANDRIILDGSDWSYGEALNIIARVINNNEVEYLPWARKTTSSLLAGCEAGND